MQFQSMDDIIRFAVEKEIEAAAFYEEASREEAYAGAREAFLEFADEERKHQNLLETFARDTDQLAAYDFKWIPDLKRSDYLVDMQFEKGMPFVEILRLAMKREEKALKLYNRLAAATGDPEFTRLFKVLSQEEAKHKLGLETLYDDLMAAQGD